LFDFNIIYCQLPRGAWNVTCLKYKLGFAFSISFKIKILFVSRPRLYSWMGLLIYLATVLVNNQSDKSITHLISDYIREHVILRHIVLNCCVNLHSICKLSSYNTTFKRLSFMMEIQSEYKFGRSSCCSSRLPI